MNRFLTTTSNILPTTVGVIVHLYLQNAENPSKFRATIRKWYDRNKSKFAGKNCVVKAAGPPERLSKWHLKGVERPSSLFS